MRRAASKLALAAVALLVALASVAVARALLARPRPSPPVPPAEEIELDAFALAGRLSRALRIATVSDPRAEHFDLAPFEELARELRRSFPRAHAALELERPGGHALLYTFRGEDPALAPLLFVAHLDVVPPGGEGAGWTRDPFGGELAGGYVHGRGALDDKSSAVAMLEAVEHLLRRGRAPRRDVLLAFGFDEELGGERGARRVAQHLEERGVVPELVLDEGLFVLEGFVEGVARPIAAIGVAEKGALALELSAVAAGGHSSMPPPSTAVGRVAGALAALDARPMRAALDPPASDFFESLYGELSFGRRLLLANGWLAGPLATRSLAGSPGTNALVRTTAAATFVEGGLGHTSLPTKARALVDFRVHPRDSLEAVLEHAQRRVAGFDVELTVRSGTPASPISPASGPGWELVARTVRQVFPDAVVAPALCIAATDARHYARLTPNVYRFLPLRLTPEEAARIHGPDERIALASYLEMVRFYVQLLANA